MTGRRAMLWLLAQAPALVGIQPAAAQASGPIRIATAGPMTGQYAAFGGQMRAGAEQAVTDINAAGGVLGRQLALEIGDRSTAAKVVQRFRARNVDPEGYVLYTYAAIQIWAAAAARTNGVDPRRIATALKQTGP